MSLGRLGPFAPGNYHTNRKSPPQDVGSMPKWLLLQSTTMHTNNDEFLLLLLLFQNVNLLLSSSWLGPKDQVSIVLPTSHCLPDTEHEGIGTYPCSDDNNFDFALMPPFAC